MIRMLFGKIRKMISEIEIIKLRALVKEIRAIKGIKRGDKMPDWSDFGFLGQMLENLLYNERGSWKEVWWDKKLRAQVIKTAECYLGHLRKNPNV